MEEILASIRQIIESNEPGAGKALSASLPPVYGADEDDRDSDIHLTVDQAYAGVEFPETIPQPDPRFVAANSAGSAPALEAPARAMSLADVAARVRAASERNTVQLQREVPPGFRQQEMRPDAPAHMFEAPQQPIEMPRIVEDSVAPVATPAPQAAIAAEKLVAPQYDVPTLPAVQPQAGVVPTADGPAEVAFAAPFSERMLPSIVEDTQPALLSQDAGLQIARSFEELAAAIDGAERRSLDEIAEDMLRPMLRDWLDDNLPTLVERLVREEIERVARGPRR
jgi:cell pole-organizing protein PopZ